MKLKIEFTKNEANALAKVTKAYDFTNHINAEKLGKKYSESSSAGRFEYSGIAEEGANIKFEVHEKLLLAASGVYLKYSDSVNGVLCSIKSLVISCKGLFKNFINDYTKELNKAFEEIRKEKESKKDKKENEEIIKEIKDLINEHK